MWTPLLFCILVVAAGQAENTPWKSNTQYQYSVRGRTLTALHQVAGQYVGIVLRASVHVQQKSDNTVSVQVNSAEYADVHTNLSQGWATPIPEDKLHYQQVPLSNKPFELKYKNGAINSMTVSKNTPTWELNILKSIASQLQVDTQAENLKSSRINSLPTKESANGVYKTMEDSVAGECETLYDISPLPKVVLQNKPQLAPLPHLQADGQLIDIVKTRNFSNCDVQSDYHFGITGLTDWEPASNQMGQFLARSSVSRIVISGNLQRYTIQSSVTTNKIIASPFLFDKQNGMVVSRMNLTLVNVKSASGSLQSPPNPQTIKNLVYEYNPASSEENTQRQYREYNQENQSSSSSSSSDSNSSSSSSSSEDSDSSNSSNNSANRQQKSNQPKNRSPRSVSGSNNYNGFEESRNNRNQYNRNNDQDSWNNQDNWNPSQQRNNNEGQRHNQGNRKNKQGDWDNENEWNNNQQQDKYQFDQKNQRNKNKNSNWNNDNASSSSSDSSSSSNESDRYGKLRNTNTNSSESSSSSSSSSNESSSSSSSSSSDSDSSSSSSFSWDSSEEDSWQPKPNLSQAPNIPFLPMFIANQGNSIQSVKQVQGVSVVKKIAHQIGNEVQTPSAIPGQKTLNKFTVLARVLRTMNAKQMEEATKELYYPLSKASSSSLSDAQKYQAWVAFRDAVAQAGTGPAILTIKEWIQSKKVQNNEAAELLSVLPYSARFPNTEYMNAFFALATSSEVQHQQFLNTSALLSFTELARKAFVSNSTAYNRFPVHVFGALKPKREQPVVQQYIPYFARALKEAVSKQDSIKIRTLTLALGNLAHPRILSVFEPYLEGKEPMTHFQRLTIVASLDKLAKIYPKVARPVLFRIYQNTGEATELRAAAVFQIMKTNPPAQLLQRMAQFTNDDQDPQVISAVQSAIKSAVNNLDNPDHQELRSNAQSAVNLLNPKEMPAQYSKKNLRSYYARQLNLAYKQSISYIGSDDGFLPSNIFYSLRQNLGGFKKQSVGFAFMSSSLNALADLIEDQFDDSHSSSSSSGHRNQQSQQGHHQSSSSDSNWSFDKINNMLNIQPSEQEQVEASLLVSTIAGKRFFAIDNHTIEMLPQLVKNAAATLRSGRNFNYTKLANKNSITVAFPTAMGLPFIFTLDTPTAIYVGGQAQAKSHPDLASGNNNEIQPPRTVNASVDVHFVYSLRAQSSIGFVVPFNHQHYVAGVNRNIQVNLPIRAEIDVDAINNKVQAKVQPLDQHNKQNVFEYSTVPYTSKHNILEMAQNPHEQTQESSNKNRKIVHVRQPNQIHKTFGKDSTGFAFDFDYHSQQKFLDFAALYNEARKHDAISAAIYAWAEDSINLNNITLAYNPQKSSAKYARFTAAYLDNSDESTSNRNSNNDGNNYRNSDRNDNQQGSGDNQRASPNDHVTANLAKPSSSSADSQSRQQEFLYKVGQGIQDSDNQVFDVSAEFQGQSKAHYVATLAVATSNVSATSRLLFWAEKNPAQSTNDNKPAQIYAAAEISSPNVPLMNYNKALNADPTSYFNAEVAFDDKSGQSARVQFKGKMQQSQARRHYLEQSPLAQRCKQQTQEGNTVQYACRNVTSQANLLDQYKLSVHFDKLPASFRNATYKTYAALRYAAYQYVNEDLISANNPSNKVELEANFAPDLKSVNVSVDAPLLSAEFNNVRLNRFIAPLVVLHPEYNPLQLYTQQVFKGQFFPTCAIDNNQAQTFDNKTYPIKLGKCWHAVFHYTPKDDPTSSSSSDEDDDDEISVLVRDASSSSEKEVMIVIGDNAIHMQPTSGDSPANVKVNGQQTSVSKNRITNLEDQSGDNYAQIYALPTGAVRFYAPQQDIEIQYDGTALKLKAQNSYRSEVRGLCGTFNTQPEDDFTTPQDCVIQNPFEFAATYALDDSSCQGPAKEYKQRAQQKISNQQCYRDVVIYGNVVTDEEAGRASSRSNSNRNYNKNYDSKRRQNQNKYDKYSELSQKCIKVIERDGKDCFSVKPQLQCSSNSNPQGSIGKQVDFVCIEPSSSTQHWKDMIRKGTNPDFSQKKPVQTYTINVPESCKA